uniref:Uncharacterized protein n=1 Tax=Steinernema glaseri TaxID=37863 RepID=A0A1I7YP16_9BILA
MATYELHDDKPESIFNFATILNVHGEHLEEGMYSSSLVQVLRFPSASSLLRLDGNKTDKRQESSPKDCSGFRTYRLLDVVRLALHRVHLVALLRLHLENRAESSFPEHLDHLNRDYKSSEKRFLPRRRGAC